MSKLLIATFATVGLFSGVAKGTPLYWDTNGTVIGSGTISTGTWGVDNFWNSDSTGGAGGSFTPSTLLTDDLFFVAGPSGSSGSSAYTVTISGTQSADSLTFQSSGAATLTGGAINTGTGGIIGSQFAFGATNRGTVSISSAIALQGSQSFINNATTAMTFSGGITSSGSVNLTIQANNSGNITISTGTFNPTGSVFNSGTGAGTTTISSAIGSGVTSITQNSATSGLILSGSNSALSGSIAIMKGGVTLSSTNALGTAAVFLGDVSGTNNAQLTISATTANASITVQGGNTGVSTIVANFVPLSGTIALLGGHGVTIQLNNSSTSGVTSKITDGGTPATVTINALANSSNGSNFGNSGNTYSGGTVIVGTGFFGVATGGNVFGTGALTYSGTGGGFRQIGSSATITGISQLILNNDMIVSGGAASIGLSFSAPVDLGATGSATTRTLSVSSILTLTGTISNGSNGITTSLNKASGGTLVLGVSSNYTGGTTVTSGTLQLSTGNDRLPTGTLLTVSSGTSAAAAGVFDLNTRNQTVGGLAGDSANAVLGVVTNNAAGSGTATLTVNPDNMGTPADSTFAGIIKNGATAKVALTKTGSHTLTLTGSNTYTGPTSVLNGVLKVNGSLGNTAVTVGNAITASLNPTLGGGSGTATGGSLQSLIGTATSQVYASSSTVGNIAGAVTISGTSASGSAGHLAPGNSVGTLTVGSLTLSGGSILDYEFNGTANDFTVVTGALTLNSGTAGINLYQEGGTTQFATAGTYDLFQYGSLVGGVSNLSVLNPNGGFTYTFGTATSGTNNYVTLTIAASGSTTPTNYTLAVSAGTSKMLTGGSTAITTTITNTGTTGQDGLSYTGLGSTVTGGPGSVTGGTTSGSLAIQTSGSNAGNQKYVSSGSSGVVTVTAGVSSANNSTLGGAATLTGSAGTVSVSVYDPASLSFSGTGNGQTWRVSNAAATAGGLRSDAIITSSTLVASQTQAGWSTSLSGTIASSGSAVAASFTPTGKLNGSYQGKLVVSAQNDQTISGASANDVLNSATTSITATVTGNTSTSRTNVSSADVLSGQSYGTTAASSGTSAHDGTSSGYGLAISGTVAGAHTSTGNAGIPTTATLINGVASARNTVKMSLDTTAANGVTNANRTSDILTLAGLNGTNPSNGQVSLTDIYVLQLTYDTSATGVEYIAWNNGSQFVNAIAGNDTGGVNGNAPSPFGTNALNESYADYLASSPGSLSQQLGAYGYYNGVAWAVLDHTGISDGAGGFQNGTNEFAVIPEPGTWGMILSGFGMLIGIQRLRRRRVGI